MKANSNLTAENIKEELAKIKTQKYKKFFIKKILRKITDRKLEAELKKILAELEKHPKKHKVESKIDDFGILSKLKKTPAESKIPAPMETPWADASPATPANAMPDNRQRLGMDESELERRVERESPANAPQTASSKDYITHELTYTQSVAKDKVLGTIRKYWHDRTISKEQLTKEVFEYFKGNVNAYSIQNYITEITKSEQADFGIERTPEGIIKYKKPKTEKAEVRDDVQ